jgi:hypothetical protein
MKTSTSNSVFEGENIIAYDHDTYIVFKEDGQGEIVIPSIERYEIKHGTRAIRENGSVDLLCPNMSVLNHIENKWSRLDETTLICSECGSQMDINNINGRAKLEEKE